MKLASRRSHRNRRALAGAALGALSLLGCRAISPTAEVPATGRPYSDGWLLQALRSDVPVEQDGLWQDPSVGVWYEALLKADPPRDYADRYLLDLRRRGVLVRAQGRSAHAIIPGIDGFEVFLLRRGPAPGITLEHARFERDRVPKGAADVLGSMPEPVRVEGRRLTFLLGSPKRPWTLQPVLPEGDVAALPELPFPRPLGAILVGTHADRRRFRDRTTVERKYVLVGGDWSRVAAHYESALGKSGFQGVQGPGSSRGPVFWGADRAHLGLLRVAVGNGAPSLVPNSGINLSELQSSIPTLLADLPGDALYFSVSLDFATWSDAERYISPAAQPGDEIRR